MRKLLILIMIVTVLTVSFISCGQVSTETQRSEYRVLSISSYYKVTRTNTFGAILDQELRYTFTYMDNDGNIYQFEDFEHIPRTWELRLGDENKYIVVDSGSNTYRYLYLTEEMFNKLSN